MKISADIAGFIVLNNSIKKKFNKSKIHSAINSVLSATATALLDNIKALTPVKTGLLKSSWQSVLKKESNSFDLSKKNYAFNLSFFNDVYYAPFVEYGHLTRSGTFVKGVYMMTKGIKDARMILKTNLTKELNNFAKN